MQEIRNKKILLTTALMSDPEYILQHVQQVPLITQREYDNIRSIQRSHEGRVIDLLDKMINKGEDFSQRFLTLLQEPAVLDTFPLLKQLFSAASLDNPIQDTQSTEEYKMSSLPRGHCLIFNNEHFTKLKERRGSSRDAEALEQVFTWLGFKVKVLQDKAGEEMRAELQRFSRMEHGDCFVCCVLSHGTEQGVYGQDDTLVWIQDILSPFNGANCPSLANKPKVFFIQACQGKRVQEAVRVYADCMGEVTDPEMDTSAVPSYKIPVDSHFLIGMATVQECISVRNVASGSWYIQSLCRQLREACPRREDILTILTRVNEEVGREEAVLRNENGSQLAKQMPEPKFTLMKRLVFPVPSPLF